jgi:hypothetical protein
MKRLQRIDGWERLLGLFIADHVESELVWGKNDCCLFACNSILTITGTDTATDFRNKYSTKDKAYKLLKEFAGNGLLETVEKLTKEFSMQEWPSPMFAQRGDLVYSEVETCLGGIRGTLGIVGMNGSIAIPGKDRLEFLPISKGARAWRV